MSKILLLSYLLLQGVWLHSALAQAPFDTDSACTHPVNFRIVPPTYDENQQPLLESRYYENLLGNNRVWQALEFDSNGGGWTTGLGGVCDQEVRSCTVRRPSPQDNYLITQYVTLFEAKEVNVQASYRFSGSVNRVFEILLFETDGVDHNKAVDKNNYRLLQSVSAVGGSSTGAVSVSFVPQDSTKGFYIAFRENGTCVTITRVLAFAHICPERVFRLVQHPQTFAPSTNSGQVIDASGECIVDSSKDNGAITQPKLECSALGVWLETEGCKCNPGFFYDTSGESEKCEACPPNTYKSTYSNSDQCIPCPDNSESSEAASYCDCKERFYRSDDEDITKECTAPPSAPDGCAIAGTKNTSISIEWGLPVDDGGREDLCFDVLFQKSNLLHEGFKKAASGLKNLEYTITDLNPITEYVIRIVSENGVSSQSEDTEQLRTVEHMASTTEGVPEKITVFARRRGSTFTWQPPTIVNGELTGFCLRVYRQGQEDDAILIDLDPLEFCYSPLAEQMPSGSGSVFVQVQAKTILGGGKWSDPLELPASQVPTSPEPIVVRCNGLVSPSNGNVLLSGTAVGSSATYSCDPGYQLVGDEIRPCQSDGTWSGRGPSCVATDNDETCMLLAAPSNGRVTQSGRNVGSFATYTCVAGHELVGVSNRVCQDDGTWSGVRPFCQAACGALLSPINGNVVQTGATFGHAAIYSCEAGYSMVGVPNRVCDSDGSWTGDPPVCLRPCNVLPNPSNGLVTITRLGSSGSRIEPGSQAVYTCNGGYQIEGNSVRDCQPNGTWSGREPICVPAVARLRFELKGTVYGNNSMIPASMIGVNGDCLACITDKTDCCGNPNRAGEFSYPNGTAVPNRGTGYSLYRGRGEQHICLHRRGTISPLGEKYCCSIPDSNNEIRKIYVTLV